MNKKETVKPEPPTTFELRGRVSDSARQLRASPESLRLSFNPNLDRITIAAVDLGLEPPPEAIIEIAESYHALFEKNRKERRLRLGRMYSELGQPGDIITLLFCKKFLPLFENWLASCEAHGIDVRNRLIVFSLDEQAHTRTSKLGIKSFFLDPRVHGEAGGSSGFGDRKFSRTMFYKNAVITELLELGANVLFQDVDMIWLKDPLDYFSAHDTQHDLYLMYDGPNRLHRPLYINTGFFYVRCNEACKALFETARRNTANIFSYGSHQQPLNRIIAHFMLHNVLSIQVLPQSEFLNGHLFNLKTGLAPAAENWQSEGYAVHYSWTADMQQKREKITKFGFNYLPDD